MNRVRDKQEECHDRTILSLTMIVCRATDHNMLLPTFMKQRKYMVGNHFEYAPRLTTIPPEISH